MFVILRFEKKPRCRLRIRTENGNWNGANFTEVLASFPRNQAQWNKLNRFLQPADHRLVLPTYTANLPISVAPVATEAFCDRVLLQAFLRYCKKNRPPLAALRPNGKLKDTYLLALCPFVGRLVLLEEPMDPDLCRRALYQCGTPIVFSDHVVSPAACLDLGSGRFLPPAGSVCFSKALFFREKSPPLPNCFADLDPLCLAAAISAQTKNHSDLQSAWIEVILSYF